MATTFTNAFANDVSHSSAVTLYTAPSATESVVMGMYLCNKTSSAVDVTVGVKDGSNSNTETKVLNQVSIPARTTLSLGKEKITLLATDAITVLSGTASAIDASVSVMEKT